jgi:farnesol dehydrogenase
MSVFVSGATGFIGIQLVKRLAAHHVKVHALYRTEGKARYIEIEGVALFKGDILDMPSLDAAMKGCTCAYHIAAFAGVWSGDPQEIYRLNVEGALNVIRAARLAGAKRVVVTSTAGILGPSLSAPVDETSTSPNSFFTLYEASKYQMEQELKRIDPNDIEVVVVNPTRVYGPGFLSESNGVTKMIKKYIKDKWRYIPGSGNQSGNYVFVEDVVTGHLLAMENGKPGERYILGGENLTYNQLFQLVRSASNIHKRLYRIPLWLMLVVSLWMKFATKITGRPPMIVPGLVRKFNHNWVVSSQKAIRELGYNPISAEEGIRKTIQWINNQF